MISRALSSSASPSRSRADGAGPNHVEAPRKRRVVPAPDVAQDCGLKFRHDVQGDDLPARRLEGPAHRRKAPGVSAFLKSKITATALARSSDRIFSPREKKGAEQ